MDFSQLNDRYRGRYGVDLPFDSGHVEEWLDPWPTNSDERYRYYHRRYTAHMRSHDGPDQDFDDMLETFGGDWQAVSVVELKVDHVLLSFTLSEDHGELLAVFPKREFDRLALR